MNPENLSVNGKSYHVLRLLGHGKGGYSYLVTDGKSRYVCKQIHHEPCDYYNFGDKLQSELYAYERLRTIGIPMPKLIDADVTGERILKEYIEGETICALVASDHMRETYFAQMRTLCAKLYAANMNIDYFPTNFVVSADELYYVDYECNDYMPEWDFEHWGIRYWSKTPEFVQYWREFCRKPNADMV